MQRWTEHILNHPPVIVMLINISAFQEMLKSYDWDVMRVRGNLCCSKKERECGLYVFHGGINLVKCLNGFIWKYCPACIVFICLFHSHKFKLTVILRFLIFLLVWAVGSNCIVCFVIISWFDQLYFPSVTNFSRIVQWNVARYLISTSIIVEMRKIIFDYFK